MPGWVNLAITTTNSCVFIDIHNFCYTETIELLLIISLVWMKLNQSCLVSNSSFQCDKTFGKVSYYYTPIWKLFASLSEYQIAKPNRLPNVVTKYKDITE